MFLFKIKNYAIQSWISIIGFGCILFGSLIFYGKKKDNNFLKWSATKIVVAVLVCYYVLIAILGIYLGFNKTYFSLDINKWFSGLIPIGLITYITEYLRFVLIKNNLLVMINLIILYYGNIKIIQLFDYFSNCFDNGFYLTKNIFIRKEIFCQMNAHIDYLYQKHETHDEVFNKLDNLIHYFIIYYST